MADPKGKTITSCPLYIELIDTKHNRIVVNLEQFNRMQKVGDVWQVTLIDGFEFELDEEEARIIISAFCIPHGYRNPIFPG